MEIKELVSLAENLRKTTKKKEKIAMLKKFLISLCDNEIEPAINFIMGNLPKINVGYATISKFEPVEAFIKISKNISNIYNYILSIGKISKEKAREAAISALLSQLNEEEREFIIHSLLGEMRHGVNEGLLLEAIAETYNYRKDEIERAYLFSSIPEIIQYAKGRKLRELKIELYKPIKPMMADMAKIEDLKGKYIVEYKFDGVRVHIHIGDKIKIFSRNLREITHYFPEIVDEMEALNKKLILDGEILAYSTHPLPFQNLMMRFRKKKKVDIPVRLFIFDILYKNGKELIDLEYEKRREILEEIAKEYLPPCILTDKIGRMREFFEEATKKGHEGIVAKEIRSLYRIRKGWYKIKKSYTLDVAIVAAEWGHGRRQKWLSDYWLAVMDNGKFHVVGKTFKGLSDEEFEDITKLLLKNKIDEKGRVVFVKPCIVAEVEFDDIQKSKRYGYALRFARIKRLRWDKDVKDINTFNDVKKLYEIIRKKKEI